MVVWRIHDYSNFVGYAIKLRGLARVVYTAFLTEITKSLHQVLCTFYTYPMTDQVKNQPTKPHSFLGRSAMFNKKRNVAPRELVHEQKTQYQKEIAAVGLG